MNETTDNTNATEPEKMEYTQQEETHKTGTGFKMMVFGLTMLFVAILAAVFLLVIWPVKPKMEKITLELGEELSEEVTDYVEGYPFALRFVEMDFSQVNLKKCGTYEFFAIHGDETICFELRIKDTTPPTLVPRDEMIYLAVGQDYDIEDLIEEAKDLSGTVELCGGEKGAHLKDHLQIRQKGEYEIQIEATDRFENTATEMIRVTVDTPPEIEGVRDYYFASGYLSELPMEVTAIDEVDGDLTKEIKMDTSAVDFSTNGIYSISYEVTDRYGLKTTVGAQVQILEKYELEDLLATRTIEKDNQHILGADNLYTAGRAVMASGELQQEHMLPCLVHIREANQAKTRWTTGSGFIIDIREDYVYICTNQHVLKGFSDLNQVFFYDGTSAEFEIVDTNKKVDVGVARVKTSQLDADFLETLRSVQYDQDHYEDAIRGKVPLFMEILTENGLDYVREGESVGLDHEFYLVDEDCLRITVKNVHGNSGSAILDEQGALIGMVIGNVSGGGQPTYYYCIPAELVVSEYERMTGNTLYKLNVENSVTKIGA